MHSLVGLGSGLGIVMLLRAHITNKNNDVDENKVVVRRGCRAHAGHMQGTDEARLQGLEGLNEM